LYKKVLHRIATFIQINIFAACFDEASAKTKRNLRLCRAKETTNVNKICLFSSVVEQLTRNEQVEGSSPLRGSVFLALVFMETGLDYFYDCLKNRKYLLRVNNK
jgi:hypothetical protein